MDQDVCRLQVLETNFNFEQKWKWRSALNCSFSERFQSLHNFGNTKLITQLVVGIEQTRLFESDYNEQNWLIIALRFLKFERNNPKMPMK